MAAVSDKGISRMYEIDLLRFGAAITIVICHYLFIFEQMFHIIPIGSITKHGIRYGYIAVDLFFIVSGYTVMLSAPQKKLKQFISGRIGRLYPVVWLVSTIIFISSFFIGSFPGYPAPTWKVYLFNLALSHDFFGRPAINGVYWTLTYEITFYFIICLITGFKLWNNILLVIVVWLGCTFLLSPLSKDSAMAFLCIPRYSPCFIAGMLFFLIKKDSETKWKVYLLLAITYALALRSANSNRHFFEDFFHVQFNPYIVLGITTFIFGLMFSLLTGKVNFGLSRFPKLAVLGDVTYSLYLVHGLGIGFFWVLGGMMNKYLLLGSVILLMLVFSWLINIFIEKKLGKLVAARTLWFLDRITYKKPVSESAVLTQTEVLNK